MMSKVCSAGMCVWLMLAFAVQKASCQVQVQAVAGDNVLLPCHFSGMNLPNVNISWRNQGDHVVLDINSVQNITSQHQDFRGRVVSFPELYQQGNFSIMLQNVQQEDSGVYECHMVVDLRQRVQLGVKVKRGPVTPGPDTSGGDIITPSSLHLTLLFLLLSSSSFN